MYRVGPLEICFGKSDFQSTASEVELDLADLTAVDQCQFLPRFDVVAQLDVGLAQNALDDRIHVREPIFIDRDFSGDANCIIRRAPQHGSDANAGRRLFGRIEFDRRA